MNIVAVPQQDEIAVACESGRIYIRQQAAGFERPDAIDIAPQHIEKLIQALRAAKREAKGQAS